MNALDFFDLLSLGGGLSLFLFGMKLMSSELENSAGDKTAYMLSKFTENKYKAFLTGLVSAAAIQSSSAVTVMVIGFVNSGMMTLKNAVGVIIGSNIGTTVTSWILSTSGIGGGTFLLDLMKPASLGAVSSIIGIILLNIRQSNKNKNNSGKILLGFSILMFGMKMMSDSVSPLKDAPWFTQMLVLFKNPIAGIFAGIILTAIIQSSSASVGILQALSLTGEISFAACIPIVLGQNIGTCVTTLIASAGAKKCAKCAAFIHLYFNVLSVLGFAVIFYFITSLINIPFLNESVNSVDIAAIHTVFNVTSAAVMMPLSGFLEKIAKRTVFRSDEAADIVIYRNLF